MNAHAEHKQFKTYLTSLQEELADYLAELSYLNNAK